MPLYEFVCKEDKQTREVILTYKDADSFIVLCEQCGKRMKRKMSVSAIKFNGGGWYGKSKQQSHIKKDE